MTKEEIRRQLLRQYPYRLELHAHTSPASPCGDIEPEQVIRIFHESGYDGIAITNHFFTGIFEDHFQAPDKKTALSRYLDDFHRAKATGEELGIRVYLGAELRWDHLSANDYLLYGIDEDMLADVFDYMKADPETFVRDCKSEKSFFVQAHPFRAGLTRLSPELLDGVEVFNMHPGHNSVIAKAERFADENGKIKTMGTDYHHKGHHNLCATRACILPEDSFALAALLKENNYIMQLGSSLILP